MHRYYYEQYACKRIMVLGIEGPPWTELALHINRVKQQLVRYRNTIYFFDMRIRADYLFRFWYRCKLFFTLLWHRPQVVFLYMQHHHDELLLLVYFKRFFTNTLVVVIVHDQLLLSSDNKQLTERCMASVDKWIYIGSKQALMQAYLSKGCFFDVEPEFIIPDLKTATAIFKTYPLDLRTFLKIHFPIIVMSNTDFEPERSLEFYGVDHTIAIMNILKAYYPHIGLVWGIAQATDPIKYAAARDRLCRGTLEYAVYLFCNEQPLWPLLKKADLFFCPSPIGESLTTNSTFAEVLFFNVPIITVADNQLPGALTYQAKNVKDCLAVLLSVLPKKGRLKVPHIVYEQYEVSR